MAERADEGADGPIVAAEYALGVLEGAELAEARRRRLADPDFAQQVEAWEAELARLAMAAAPVAPPPAVWPRIEARLDGEGGADSIVALRLRRSVAIWRGATAAAAGVAACLLVALAWPRPVPATAPVLTARLSATGKGPAVFVALYDPERRAIVLTPADVAAAPGRSPELWLIPAGGKPIALGVADFAGSVQLASTHSAAGLSAGALAVSIEPAGGSPTGQPTGPVIATGQLSRL
jgi:anti-sigma-K factor RskA